VDPVDPDPDPQHWFLGLFFVVIWIRIRIDARWIRSVGCRSHWEYDILIHDKKNTHNKRKKVKKFLGLKCRMFSIEG
jgi:hypothetical protein